MASPVERRYPPQHQQRHARRHPIEPFDRSRLTQLTFVLLALRGLFVVARIVHGPVLDETLGRFSEIAHTAGLPYRDYPVEYAPIDLVLILAVAGRSFAALWAGVHLIALAADVATWATLNRRWGRGVGAAYLLLGFPLVWLCYTRLDLVGVFLATSGMSYVIRDRERFGGAIIGIAGLAKLWPMVLVAPLAGSRARRSVTWVLMVAAVGTFIWWAAFGPNGIRDVLTYRGATGWSVESTVGAATWLLTGGPVLMQEGAQRVGVIQPWVRVGLLFLVVAGLLAVALRSRKWSSVTGAPALSAVACLLTCAPLYSLQYASWLLPWAAVAFIEGAPRPQKVSVIVVIVTTAVLAAITATGGPIAATQALLVIRAMATAATCLTWLASRADGRPNPANPLA